MGTSEIGRLNRWRCWDYVYRCMVAIFVDFAIAQVTIIYATLNSMSQNTMVLWYSYGVLIIFEFDRSIFIESACGLRNFTGLNFTILRKIRCQDSFCGLLRPRREVTRDESISIDRNEMKQIYTNLHRRPPHNQSPLGWGMLSPSI